MPGLRRIRPALLLIVAAAACSSEEVEPADRELPALLPRAESRSCLAELPDPMPARLSETGCFTSLSPLTPGPDLIPYEVISPLWTDDAFKERYLVLSPGDAITYDDAGAWDFPLGAVIVKVFGLEMIAGDETSRRVVETRFMVRRATGWTFHSYEWNADGTDATLLTDGQVVPFEVQTAEGPHVVDYQFPSEEGCAACHGTRVGEPLGPRTEQLNLTVRYGTEVKNQLDALVELGAIELPGEAADLPSMPDPADESAPLAARARAYLHANCSHCHQPGGWTSPGVDMDLRYSKTLAEMNACDVRVAFDLVPGADFRIAAGDPEGSSLWRRIQVEGVGVPTQMPPLGRSTNDDFGIELIRQWILSLESCPDPIEPMP